MEEGEPKRDRISEMPQEIKEKILSSLCIEDAVCTSTLSSVWRYSWISRPFLNFGHDFFLKFTSFFGTLPATHPKKQHLYSIFHFEDNYWITKDARQIIRVGYLQMLDEILQVYIRKNPSLRVLKKMSLYVPMLSDSNMRDYGALVVSRCLSLAKHNVGELIYWVDDNFGLPYRGQEDSYYALQNCLPILDSKTLTKLELHGCYLATEKKLDVPIDLPNLKHLRLILLNIDENMLETLLAKCRALEKLKFSACKGFKVLRVPRLSNLKELEVKYINDLDLVEINALEIQSLTLIDLNTKKLKMTSNSCNNLVNLFVVRCSITDDFFNNVAEFPHLETISLVQCPKLKHIKITGNALTSLKIEECPNLSQAEVDTPKLCYLSGDSSTAVLKRRF